MRLMNDELIVRILQIVANNGNLANLIIHESISYSVLKNILESFVKQSYLSYQNNQYFITQSGVQYLDNLNKKLKRKGLYRYISPSPLAEGIKIDEDDPYIPKIRNLGLGKKSI